jgi:hypothetical protein
MGAATGRRALRFETIDEALAEAARLAAAEGEGRLSRCGNWELGQTLNHLATWCDYAFDGYPAEVGSPPWLVRVIARGMKRRILTKGMMAGMKIGRVKGGTLGVEVVSTEEGMRRMGKAFARLKGTCPAGANPAFGPLTHEEWVALNLRHAELHLGFQIPQ